MRIGTHNSFTYLPVRRWWMRPLAFTARCQRKTVAEQWEVGARLFDLRVRFGKDGALYAAHGLVEYKPGAVECGLDQLDVLSLWTGGGGRTAVRVVLERRSPTAEDVARFRDFCGQIERGLPCLRPFGGWSRGAWGKPLYDFMANGELSDAVLSDKYASADGLFPGWPAWLCAWWPWLYARLRNRRNRREHSGSGTDKWLLTDFIDIE